MCSGASFNRPHDAQALRYESFAILQYSSDLIPVGHIEKEVLYDVKSNLDTRCIYSLQFWLWHRFLYMCWCCLVRPAVCNLGGQQQNGMRPFGVILRHSHQRVHVMDVRHRRQDAPTLEAHYRPLRRCAHPWSEIAGRRHSA